MKNTVHNMKWSAKVKIAKLQKVKGAERAEKPPSQAIIPTQKPEKYNGPL